MTKSSTCNKGKALHISQWIKGELGGGRGWDGGGGRGYRKTGNGDDRDDNDNGEAGEDEEFELWSAERMNAKRAEVERRLLSMARYNCHGEVAIECVAETLSAVSSPDDSQVSINIIFLLYYVENVFRERLINMDQGSNRNRCRCFEKLF